MEEDSKIYIKKLSRDRVVFGKRLEVCSVRCTQTVGGRKRLLIMFGMVV